MSKRALIIVDVQNDFISGSLKVPSGEEVVSVFNGLRKKVWDLIVLTQDFHPKDHSSFISNSKDGIWPDHCVQGTDGCEFHKDLVIEDTDEIVQKGENVKVDSYSGFFDNDKKSKTGLDDLLKKHGIKKCYIGGLATDYCVRYTCEDSSALGYETYLITDASRGIAEESINDALKALKEKNVQLIESKDI